MPTATDLRDGTGAIGEDAAAHLADLWPTLSTADQARDALMDELPVLVDGYGAAASTLAADWFDEARAQAGVAGRFAAIPAAPELGGLKVTIRWAVGPLYQAVPDWDASLSLIAGATERAVADAARATVTGSAVQDRRSKGWRRVGAGECDFCTMLILRGSVFKEATARFASHNGCRCAAVPDFGIGESFTVNPYVPSKKLSTAASRARVRARLREQNAN